MTPILQIANYPALNLPFWNSSAHSRFRRRNKPDRSGLFLFLENLAVAAAYAGTAWLGLLIAIPPGLATPVWIPSGIALAAVLMLGYRVLPGIAAGSFFVNFFRLFAAQQSSTFTPILIACGISGGSALQAFVGAYFIQIFIKNRHPFDRLQDVFKFTWIEIFSCLVSPTIGTLSLFAADAVEWEETRYHWWTWWTGDLVGVLAITPLLLAWSRPARKYWKRERVLKAAAYFILLSIVSYGVFGGDSFDGSFRRFMLPYVLVPFIVWSAFWFGDRGVTLSTLFVSTVAVIGTYHGQGPFIQKVMNESFLTLQPFIAILSVTGLIYSASLAERAHAHDELKSNQKSLVDFVENAPVGLHWVGPNGIIIWANQAELNLLGYSREEYIGHSVTEFYVHKTEIEEILTRLSNHEEIENYETGLRCKDGSIRQVLISSNVLWDNGTFVHTRCFTRDITDRKRAEDDLLHAHAELEQRVIDRTLELSKAYKALEIEMAEKLQAQKDILDISEREQKRIGQDLHDGIAQQLSGLSFMNKTLQYKLAAKSLSEAEDIVQILDLLKKTIDDTRRLSRGFYPVELEKLGLFPALEELARDTEKIYNIVCLYRFDPSIELLNDAVSAHVYRMTQEAISNAVKHGKAKRVNLSMKRNDGKVVLNIEDDGIGFPSPENLKPRMGLRIMNYRATMIGGTFDIQRKAEGGTRVTFRFPI